MLKRLLTLGLCLGVALFLTSYSFSQTGAKEEKKAEEMAGDETIEPGEKKATETTKAEYAALQAKTYFDGISTFANSKVLFKLTAKDNILVDKIEFKIDNGALQTFGEPFSISSEGKHTIAFYGIDKLGNKEDERIYKITIDNTPPELVVMASRPLLKSGERLFSSKAVNFTVSAKDALSGVNKTEYSTDGIAYGDYVTPFSIVKDGDVELRVKSGDNVTNVASTFAVMAVDETGREMEIREAAVKIFMDNVAPVVTIKGDKEFLQKDGKNIASTDYKYAVNATDGESGVALVMVRVDGKGDFMPYKGDILFSTNGEHIIEARALDKVGNLSTTAVLSVFVDVVPPETVIETLSEK